VIRSWRRRQLSFASTAAGLESARFHAGRGIVDWADFWNGAGYSSRPSKCNESLGKGGRWAVPVFRPLAQCVVVSELPSRWYCGGAGLMIRSMTSLLAMPPGFRTDSCAYRAIHLTRLSIRMRKRVKAFCSELLDRVSRLPGREIRGDW